MSNTVLLWGQIVTIVTFIIALFILYKLLVDQKDATIQLLKEKNDWLQKELDIARQSLPDILMKNLNDRVKVLTEEMERLSKDKAANEAIIKKKNEERERVELEIQKLRNSTEQLVETLRGTINSQKGFNVGLSPKEAMRRLLEEIGNDSPDPSRRVS